MNTAPIAGLVSKAKNSKPKAEGVSTQIFGDHASAVEYFATSLRDAERKATGRSLSRVDARAQVTAMIFAAFFTGSKKLVKAFDEDTSWIADLENFTDWASLAAVLPKEGDDTPPGQDSTGKDENAKNEVGSEGDSKNQENLAFENDEHGAGTHQANSEEEGNKGAADSEEELSEMERLEREMNAGRA
jgi:hypothetical protein